MPVWNYVFCPSGSLFLQAVLKHKTMCKSLRCAYCLMMTQAWPHFSDSWGRRTRRLQALKMSKALSNLHASQMLFFFLILAHLCWTQPSGLTVIWTWYGSSNLEPKDPQSQPKILHPIPASGCGVDFSCTTNEATFGHRLCVSQFYSILTLSLWK